MQHFDESAVPHNLTVVEGQRAVWISGPSCIRYEAIGESYNPEQMQRVVAWLQGRTDTAVHGWLVAEPTVRAVAIWVLGGKVGYLPHELAPPWLNVLARLGARYGVPVGCSATLDPPSAANQGGYGIIVWLPDLFAAPVSQPVPSVRYPGPSPSVREPEAPPAPAAKAPPPPPSRPAAPAPAAVPEIAKEPAISPEGLAKLRAEIDAAKRELASVEEALDIQSFGFYTPKYGLESSVQYASRLATVRADQKKLMTDDKAAPCETTWTIGGSASEGRKMVKQQAKLMLRAFNGECDAAIAKVKYDNVVTLEQRLKKAYETINKLGEVQRVFISARYFD